MPNFYQCADADIGLAINLDLVCSVNIVKYPGSDPSYRIKVQFSGHSVEFGNYSKEDAEQELTNFLSHCEGQFRD